MEEENCNRPVQGDCCGSGLRWKRVSRDILHDVLRDISDDISDDVSVVRGMVVYPEGIEPPTLSLEG